MADGLAHTPDDDGAGDAPDGAPATESWKGSGRAFLAIFAPFVIALFLSFGFRVWALFAASEALDVSRERVAAKIEENPAISDAELEKSIFGELPDDTHTRARLLRIVRRWAVACPAQDSAEASVVDPRSSPRDSELGCRPRRQSAVTALCGITIGCNRKRGLVVADKLLGGAVFADMLVQSLLVLIFPGLFFAALGRVVHKPAKGKLGADYAFDVIRHYLTSDRLAYLRVQERDRFHFFRRFAFALTLTLGTQYMLSPAGMQASAMGELPSLLPEPGQTSLPFFAEYFVHSPPYVIGFAGFYLYALTSFLGRFSARTLNHLVFLQMFRRGLAVLILSLILSGIFQGSSVNAVVFIAGFFPEEGFHYLQKIAQGVTGKLTSEEPEVQGFRALPELDVSKQAALAEVGVTSSHDLAHIPWHHVLRKTGIDPMLLLHAADRALLIDLLGGEAADKLKGLPLRTASGLSKYLADDPHGDRATVVRQVLDVKDVAPIVAILGANPNIRFVNVLLPKAAIRHARAEFGGHVPHDFVEHPAHAAEPARPQAPRARKVSRVEAFASRFRKHPA